MNGNDVSEAEEKRAALLPIFYGEVQYIQYYGCVPGSSIIEWPGVVSAASDIASWAQSELWGTCHEAMWYDGCFALLRQRLVS